MASKELKEYLAMGQAFGYQGDELRGFVEKLKQEERDREMAVAENKRQDELAEKKRQDEREEKQRQFELEKYKLEKENEAKRLEWEAKQKAEDKHKEEDRRLDMAISPLGGDI